MWQGYLYDSFGCRAVGRAMAEVRLLQQVYSYELTGSFLRPRYITKTCQPITLKEGCVIMVLDL